MSILFREGDSIAAKGYMLFILFSLAFSCYGMFVNFTPSSMIREISIVPAWIAGFVIMVPIFFDKNPKSKIKEKPWFYPIIYLLLTGINYSVLVFSAPSLIVGYFGNQFESRGIVYGKFSGFSKTCNNTMRVKDIFNEEYKYYICTNRSFIEKVEVNDYLAISGNENSYGRKISDFEIIKANKVLKDDAAKKRGAL